MEREPSKFRRGRAGFSLLEISVVIGLGAIMGLGIIGMLNVQTAIMRSQMQSLIFTTTLPQLRNVVERTAGQASRVRVFVDANAARAGTTTATANGGAVRLEYLGGSNTPGTAWVATLEYRAQQLIYRNQSGAEWVAASGVDACAFSIVDGALRISFTVQGRSADCFVAVN